MTNNGSKADNATPATLPESDAFGKPGGLKRVRRVVRVVRRPNPRMREGRLPGDSPEQSTRWFVDQFSRKYPGLTTADKRHLLAFIKRNLPPLSSPGRPRREDVTKAIQLERENVSRKEIYRRLGKVTPAQQRSLLEAMRQRRARSRKRDKSATVTPTNPA
jgi:hypothetical protein